jgi:glycogen synthase
MKIETSLSGSILKMCIVFGFLQLIFLFMSTKVITNQFVTRHEDHIYVENREGKHEFDVDIVPRQYSIPENIPIFHVTKEFGPAILGGLGNVVTSLSKKLKDTGLNVNIVMPYYKFLNLDPDLNFTLYSTLEFSIRSESNGILGKIVSYFTSDDGIINIKADVYKTFYDGIPLFLIGPGNLEPFSFAFDVDKKLEMYSSPPQLDHQWQALFFIKGASKFIQKEQEKSLALNNEKIVVHLHGSTNALVLHEFQDSHSVKPKFIYTLHDYSYESFYYVNVENLKLFMHSFNSVIEPSHSLRLLTMAQKISIPKIYPVSATNILCNFFCLSNEFYPSGYGIAHADVVTFVSKSVAKSILDGRLLFPLRGLVTNFINAQASRRRFFGITNGISFESLNPFTHKDLVEHGMSFPIDSNLFKILFPSHEYINVSSSVTEQKRKAKSYLQSKPIFEKLDLSRPLVLYMGRFEFDKGMKDCIRAVPFFAKNNVNFVVMGYPNNFPVKYIKTSKEMYENHFAYILSLETQLQFGIFLRAAADFVFVPR